MKKVNLTNEFDARIWAKEFMKIVMKPGKIIDEETMLSWFANAIMAGYDRHRWDDEKAARLEVLELPEIKDMFRTLQKAYPYVEQKTIRICHPSDADRWQDDLVLKEISEALAGFLALQSRFSALKEKLEKEIRNEKETV